MKHVTVFFIMCILSLILIMPPVPGQSVRAADYATNPSGSSTPAQSDTMKGAPNEPGTVRGPAGTTEEQGAPAESTTKKKKHKKKKRKKRATEHKGAPRGTERGPAGAANSSQMPATPQ